jgi:hypothetical protein
MALVKNAHKIEACDVHYNMVFELPTHWQTLLKGVNVQGAKTKVQQQGELFLD